LTVFSWKSGEWRLREWTGGSKWGRRRTWTKGLACCQAEDERWWHVRGALSRFSFLDSEKFWGIVSCLD
jgi:hypothetical protein